jgi:uncharacterized protein (TIGR03083 family)
MDAGRLVDQLESDGPLLAFAADRAGWEAPVPGTRWNVRELVVHAGGVYRWATSIVTNGLSENDAAAAGAVGTGPGDDDLLNWFSDGHAGLLSALRSAPPELDCFSFLPAPSALAFWARRQAHETAIHRADAEAAGGGMASFPPAFAQDGIAELLLGFARRRSQAVRTAGAIALHATDGPSWLVTLGGDRNEAVEGVAAGDVTVSGSSSDLYLWLWNRPTHAEVTGDPAVAALWRRVRVRWG